MLRYQIKTDLGAISQEEWGGLLKDSETGTVFQTPEYLSAWCEAFLTDKREICLVEVYDNNELIGLAPLRKQRQKITFLGTDRVGKGQDLVTDFGDIVAKKGREKEVWEQIILGIKETGEQEITLDYVRENSPSLKLLKDQGHKISEMVDNANPDVAPFFDLPKTWEEYLTQLSREERHELRRKLRRLEAHGYTVAKAEINTENINEFIRLHKASTVEKDRFMTFQMEGFFQKIAKNLSDSKRISLSFMHFGQENVSATFSFIWKNEFWLYNSGFDRKYDYLAVGFLLKALTVSMAIENGLERYSFLRGNERYKYDLGAKDEKLYKMVIKF